MEIATQPIRTPFLGRCRALAADIKIAHSVFALPFALLSAFLAARGWPPRGQLVLIVICMVTARTVAMTSNRLFDAALDARNPRTAGRAIPSGRVSPAFFMGSIVLFALGFIAATGGFWVLYHNRWPLIFSPLVLLFLASYPLLKRFTGLCHYYLGAALGLAPLCAWVAIAGMPTWAPIVMGLAVLAWTAGFDIIYACQDFQVDVADGLHSVPARLGIGKALWVSRATHAFAVAMLVTLGTITPCFQMFYWAGVAIAIGLLLIEHSLVKADDLSKVNVAFFTVNGMISVLMGTLGIIDILRYRFS